MLHHLFCSAWIQWGTTLLAAGVLTSCCPPGTGGFCSMPEEIDPPFTEQAFNQRLPRGEDGLVQLPFENNIPDALGPEILQACKRYLNEHGYGERQIRLAEIRWAMAFEDLLLLNVYTGGRGSAASARLVYSPTKKEVLGTFNYGDARR